jgi:tetratricopeptide (TPR) repeat protein
MTQPAEPLAPAPADDRRAADLQRIRRYLIHAPRDSAALSEAAGLLHHMGRFDEAIAHLRQAAACGACPLRESADTDGDDACAPDEEAVDAGVSRHYQVLKQLGDCYAGCDRPDLAERHYCAAAALAPDRAEAYLGLGVLAFQQGHTDDAQHYFRTARELEPDCGEAYGGLAMVHQHCGRDGQAFEMYLKCLELDTDNLVALLGLFQTSCRMGNFSKLIHYLEVYLSRHPDDASVLFCLATLQGRQGQLAAARRTALRLLAAAPEMTEAADLLAKLDEALGAVRARPEATA